jgi:octaprenyl-diphosphate synthase
VLVGDFLYSRAFQMLVKVGNLSIMQIMSDATNLIAEGEVLQLVNAGNPETSEDSYYQVIHFKTAQLFEAAAQLAAVIAEPTEQDREASRLYGYHLGMAFQLVDDMLDYSGDVDALGKNLGDDLAEGKPTLPLIYTLQNGSADEQALVHHAILHKDASQLKKIIVAVNHSGGLEYTRDKAKYHVDQALHQLNGFPCSVYRQALEELAIFAVERSN